MLVISRRCGQRLKIGPNIEVIVTKIDRRGEVRLAISAPRHVSIVRDELLLRPKEVSHDG